VTKAHLRPSSSRAPQRDGSPDLIETELELDDALTTPRPALVQLMRHVKSPLLVLGAGGKMGPTLAALAGRAAEEAGVNIEIIAVSRFSNPATRRWLKSHHIKTCVADLFDRRSLRRLPNAENIIYLVGQKFGTSQNPSLTWAANTLPPTQVAERYAGARIVALSTGNVYPLVPITTGGAREDCPLTPLGEYANAAVARERVFDYFSRQNGTHVALIRLNYAVELRYGVLVDIARKVWMGEPVDLANGFFNCIWQGDANEMILRALSLASSPASAWNLTGAGVISVRDVARRLVKLLNKSPQFTGRETGTALLSNPTKLHSTLGPPSTSLENILRWTAHWVKSGGRDLGKPTHFEVRDGRY